MNQENFIPFVVIAAIMLILILKSVVIVTEKTTVIIERLGKFMRVAESGISFIIPFIDRKAFTLNMRVQQLDVSVETKTLDNVFVNLQISVQYQVVKDKVRDAYYALDNSKTQIASYVYDDVRAEVPKLELDDVFSKKDDIAQAVRQNIADIMDDYGYSIIKTLITDIDPDVHVKEAMNRINAAKRGKEAALEEAEGNKIRIVKEAEAEAESKRLAGVGIAQQRLEIVRGFKESVEDFQKTLENVSHEEVMQFVLLTQYFDTINNVGSNSKNTSILIPHSPGSVRDFQEQIIKGTFIGGKFLDDAKDDSKDDSKGKK
jgi:regulator of protease activity HflC (stomatin/prohibitin superfamily)